MFMLRLFMLRLFLFPFLLVYTLLLALFMGVAGCLAWIASGDVKINLNLAVLK